MTALVEAGAPVATIVGKTWDFHVTEALGTTLDIAHRPSGDETLAKATPVQVSQVAGWWTRLEPYLAIVRSPAGRIGLRYAIGGPLGLVLGLAAGASMVAIPNLPLDRLSHRN
jgi:hypothetical protein